MNANSFKENGTDGKNAAGDALDEAVDKVAQLGRKTRDGAAEALNDAKDYGQSTARKLKDRASEASAAAEDRLDDFSDTAQSGLRSAKAKLADGGDRLVRALHDAADGTRSASNRAVDAFGKGISEVGDHLNANSINDLVASTKAYARRHPGTVAAGAAVLGFAFAHLVNASRNRR